MKKKIINGLLFAVALVAATSSFVSCKDYEGDNYAEFQEKYATLQEAYNAQVQAMKDYVLTSRYNKEVLGGTSYDHAKAIQQRLIDLETDTASLAKRIAENNKWITKLSNDTLKPFIYCWGPDLQTAMTNAANVFNTVSHDSAEWNRAVEVADSAYNFIHNNYKGEFKNLQEMIDAYKAADQALQEEIDELNQHIDNLLATIKMDITGIEIQATKNPIYGTFAYPFGAQSNVLAAYYGKADAGYTFPTTEDNKWLNGQSVLTEAELAGMAASKAIKPYDLKRGIICDDTEGNAGTLYLTINPSNVVLVGKDFTLRTSDNKLSKVTLSDLKPCDEQLVWGYKRAAANENSANGFYSAKATIAKEVFDDVKLGTSFDYKSLNNAISDVFTDWANPGVLNIGNINNVLAKALMIQAPRLNVQAQWKDTTGWKFWASKYELAAVSVKPFGVGTTTGTDFSKWSKMAQDTWNQKVQNVRTELWPLIAFQLADGDYKKMQEILNNYTFQANGKSDLDIYKKGSDTPYHTITLNDDENKSVVEGYNALLKLVNGLQGRIDNKTTEIRNALDDILERYSSRMNKIFNKINLWLAEPYRFFMPALYATSDAENLVHLSRVIDGPTYVKAGTELAFYPTTVTNELLAPAYKKFIGVSNVFKGEASAVKGDADCKAVQATLNNAVADFNHVVDGTAYNMYNPMMGFKISDEMKGMIIEITYVMLDYEGVSSAKKFYIEVLK